MRFFDWLRSFPFQTEKSKGTIWFGLIAFLVLETVILSMLFAVLHFIGLIF